MAANTEPTVEPTDTPTETVEATPEAAPAEVTAPAPTTTVDDGCGKCQMTGDYCQGCGKTTEPTA